MYENKDPLITFCIPAYNSSGYLHYAVDSLIPFGDSIEILIVDDGSTDETPKLADYYQSSYPDFVRAIHQANGGHGKGINTGIAEARGIYFKVLDSDDWVDPKALSKLLAKIKEEHAVPDLYICDYRYWQGRDNPGQYISYSRLFDGKTPFYGWDDLPRFRYSSNITLHSAMFKTSVLKASGVHCPEHVSYEDNYFVYCPLPYVKCISYLPMALYQYLIGREGQSMENATCIRKYHDYIVDGLLIFKSYDIIGFKKERPGLYRAMMHHLLLNMLMVPSFSRLNGSKKALDDLKGFWAQCKESNSRLYHHIRRKFPIFYLMFPGKTGLYNVKIGYRLSHHVVKFN